MLSPVDNYSFGTPSNYLNSNYEQSYYTPPTGALETRFYTQGQMPGMAQAQYLTSPAYGAFRTMPNAQGYMTPYQSPSMFANYVVAHNGNPLGALGINMPALINTYNPYISPSIQMAQAVRGNSDKTIGLYATAADFGFSSAVAAGVGMINPLLGIAAGFMVPSLTSPMLDRVRTTRAIQNMTMTHILGGPDLDRATGLGLNSNAAYDLDRHIRRMAANNMIYKENDFRDLLEIGMEFGMFDFKNSVNDYKNFFTQLKDTIRGVSDIIGSSDFKEIISELKRLRSMGVNDPMLIQSLRTEGIIARAAGMSHADMLETFGKPGSMIAAQMGLNPYSGMYAGMTAGAMVKAGMRSGVFTPSTLARMGGESGVAELFTRASMQERSMLIPLLGAFVIGEDGKIDQNRRRELNEMMSRGELTIENILKRMRTINGGLDYAKVLENADEYGEKLYNELGGAQFGLLELNHAISEARHVLPAYEVSRMSQRDLFIMYQSALTQRMTPEAAGKLYDSHIANISTIVEQQKRIQSDADRKRLKEWQYENGIVGSIERMSKNFINNISEKLIDPILQKRLYDSDYIAALNNGIDTIGYSSSSASVLNRRKTGASDSGYAGTSGFLSQKLGSDYFTDNESLEKNGSIWRIPNASDMSVGSFSKENIENGLRFAKESVFNTANLSGRDANSAFSSIAAGMSRIGLEQTNMHIRKVKYKHGAKDVASGVVDCSGWVAYITRKAMDSLNEQYNAQLFDKEDFELLSPNKVNSAQIIENISNATGEEYSREDILKNGPTDGMIIGINADKKPVGENGYDSEHRYRGIDHVVQIVKQNGELYVTESNSSSGVTITPWSKWKKHNVDKHNRDFVGVDPSKLADWSQITAARKGITRYRNLSAEDIYFGNKNGMGMLLKKAISTADEKDQNQWQKLWNTLFPNAKWSDSVDMLKKTYALNDISSQIWELNYSMANMDENLRPYLKKLETETWLASGVGTAIENLRSGSNSKKFSILENKKAFAPIFTSMAQTIGSSASIDIVNRFLNRYSPDELLNISTEGIGMELLTPYAYTVARNLHTKTGNTLKSDLINVLRPMASLIFKELGSSSVAKSPDDFVNKAITGVLSDIELKTGTIDNGQKTIGDIFRRLHSEQKRLSKGATSESAGHVNPTVNLHLANVRTVRSEIGKAYKNRFIANSADTFDMDAFIKKYNMYAINSNKSVHPSEIVNALENDFTVDDLADVLRRYGIAPAESVDKDRGTNIASALYTNFVMYKAKTDPKYREHLGNNSSNNLETMLKNHSGMLKAVRDSAIEEAQKSSILWRALPNDKISSMYGDYTLAARVSLLKSAAFKGIPGAKDELKNQLVNVFSLVNESDFEKLYSDIISKGSVTTTKDILSAAGYNTEGIAAAADIADTAVRENFGSTPAFDYASELKKFGYGTRSLLNSDDIIKQNQGKLFEEMFNEQLGKQFHLNIEQLIKNKSYRKRAAEFISKNYELYKNDAVVGLLHDITKSDDFLDITDNEIYDKIGNWYNDKNSILFGKHGETDLEQQIREVGINLEDYNAHMNGADIGKYSENRIFAKADTLLDKADDLVNKIAQKSGVGEMTPTTPDPGDVGYMPNKVFTGQERTSIRTNANTSGVLKNNSGKGIRF